MRSQNGWPVITDTAAGRAKLTDLALPGTMPHHVYVLAGPVATVARWHVREYHRRVEPIKPAACWGWNVRRIGDGDDWSNHSSATAWDLNAQDNPDGAPPTRVMTTAQILACHELERESGGVLSWGGDWSDPDPMHWEIKGTPEQVAAAAAKIERDEMTSPTAEQNAAAAAGRDIDPGPGTYSWGGATWTMLGRTAVLNALPGQIADLRADLDAKVQDVDDELDGMGASLVLLVAMVSSLAADPADTGEAHPIVAAFRYVLANPAPVDGRD